jgi:hypothetical protein
MPHRAYAPDLLEQDYYRQPPVSGTTPIEWRLPAQGPRDTAVGSPLSEEFARLTEWWKDDTALLSSASDIAAHPAYKRIIELGELALPLILEDMARAPHHWFLALQSITNVDPVPAWSRGKVDEMTRAWLDWGRVHGII